jgi:hypothetical protein
LRALLRGELHNVTVRIAHQDGARDPERRVRELHHASGHEVVARRAIRVGEERRLPVYEIVGVLVGRHRTAVARREVFEQLDSRSGSRA